MRGGASGEAGASDDLEGMPFHQCVATIQHGRLQYDKGQWLSGQWLVVVSGWVVECLSGWRLATATYYYMTSCYLPRSVIARVQTLLMY